MSSTYIRDLLKISPHFVRSVNLERDFTNPRVLDGYVVTTEASGHLRRIGNGLNPDSGQRAWRITGDFGSGKSSFALVLANLLGRPAKELPPSIRSLGKDLGSSKGTPKLLPILVTGSREPLALAVLRGVHSALTRSTDGSKKSAAKDHIAELLIVGKADDREAIKLIEDVASEVTSKGMFDGVLLIIDELGKFLEFAALNPEQQDVYFLQTLAETSCRSGTSPIYTLGLLHQGFAEYAEKLPSLAQLEWAKVSERFQEIQFSQPLGQVSTLLAAALSLNSDHKSLSGWKGKARTDMVQAIDLGMFGPNAGKTSLSQLAPDLYPIHAAVIPVLARFFRRFGQNERSLFSFLLSSEPFALQDFATGNAGPENVYRLSNFYDFAAVNFAQQLSGQSFRSHWNHIDAIIRSAEHETTGTLALLKTVGILNVIESPELSPSEDVLALALGQPKDLVDSLKDLCRRGILFNRGRSGYSLWPYTSVNLEQRIKAAHETVSHASPIAEVVRERLDARPIVARRHYIQTGNLRYFDVRFLTAGDLTSRQADLKPTHPADGVVAVILCESVADRQRSIKMAGELKEDPSLVIAISPPLESLSSSSLELQRWLWVERETPELKDDRFAAEEVSRQIATSSQLLENRIHDYVGFRGGSSSEAGKGIAWFHLGKAIKDFSSGKSLQTFLSHLCDEQFHAAPRVHNELVNRYAISAAAASARQKLFKAMLNQAGEPLLGLPEDKGPPEKSMYLSILEAGRFHRKEKDGWQIAFPEPDSDPLNIRPALDAIMAHLEKQPDRRVPVGELYDLLRTKPYGVRDGLIPIFLMAVFIVHETEIAIYEDGVFQPETEEFLAMRFARVPHSFEFQLCRINGVRRALINELAAVVHSEHAEEGKILSIVRPLCLFVDGLPEYVRNTDRLSPETLAVRKAIETAREPSKLVFHAIPEAFGYTGKSKKDLDPSALGRKLGISLLELRRSYPELHSRMSQAITEAFETDLSLEKWRTSISASAETMLVGLSDLELRAFSLKLVDDGSPETEWLEALGSMLVRCPPSRWKDRDELAFCERVQALSGQFNRVLATCFDKNGALPDTAIRVAVTPRNGEEKDLVVNLSPTQAKDAEKLRQSIRNMLPTGSQVSLAALSQVLWDILKQSK